MDGKISAREHGCESQAVLAIMIIKINHHSLADS